MYIIIHREKLERESIVLDFEGLVKALKILTPYSFSTLSASDIPIPEHNEQLNEEFVGNLLIHSINQGVLANFLVKFKAKIVLTNSPAYACFLTKFV